MKICIRWTLSFRISLLLSLLIPRNTLSFQSNVIDRRIVEVSIISSKRLASHLSSSFALEYRTENGHDNFAAGSSIGVKNVALKKKPIINDIKSLTDFQSFLDQDNERLVAVKFYAPWCQSCRRLGNHYQKLASAIGDGIVQRKKVEGKVRFAAVQFSFRAGKEMSVSETITTDFVTNILQVKTIPTLHLYYGHHKVWEASGKTTTKELKQAIDEIERLTSSNTGYSLETLANDRDDGILKQAIEDSFYEYPSFLDEEW